jgi:hypothetical protein
LVQDIRWLPGIRRMMAERTGQGTAWYAGTYTRSQNHSEPRGRGGGATWYLAAIFCCAATIR